MSQPETHFAPAERLEQTDVLAEAAFLRAQPHVSVLLNGYPGMAFILNTQRQIILCNEKARLALREGDLAMIPGMRVGEAFHCEHSHEMPGGCGTSKKCATCGAVLAMLDAVNGVWNTRDLRLTVEESAGHASFDFRVWASPLVVEDRRFIVFALQDISSEKRREILERIFFHDLLNTAGVIKGLATLFTVGEEEIRKTVVNELEIASDKLVNEIRVQQDLAVAERGELTPRFEEVATAPFLMKLAAQWRHHKAAEARHVVTETMCVTERLRTDPTLLDRVLSNLIKNALEASSEDATITVRCAQGSGGSTLFSVNNPGVIPEVVQLQIFERSFSTKGQGRGLGTYSVRLLTEKYLGGRVWFESNDERGTTFFVEI